MITTKRLLGTEIPGETSAEVVYVYDMNTKSIQYQFRINGAPATQVAQSVATEQYYGMVSSWLDLGAAGILVGMPLGILSETRYTEENQPKESRI